MEFEPGSVVLWNGMDGWVGIVRKSEAGVTQIAFAAGRESVRTNSVRPLAVGELVRYNGDNEDLSPESLGRVARIAPTGMITAVFPEGEFTLPYTVCAHVNQQQALRAGFLV
mmetsp:Transcript_49246/g.145399  ORF Transcript_49246/g.145399 Transcript_49246/m.145399 type:complete len:112 (-) Transcript_49246:26-361(-)